jgi:hypothetical protein
VPIGERGGVDRREHLWYGIHWGAGQLLTLKGGFVLNSMVITGGESETVYMQFTLSKSLQYLLILHLKVLVELVCLCSHSTFSLQFLL